MPYKFALDRPDYTDLASGAVLHSLPGHPAFPIRLGSEIFQRCLAILDSGPRSARLYTLFDPCCGTAYLLCTLAYLHGSRIREIIASDIDPQAVFLAKRNLDLICGDGMPARTAELKRMADQFGKESHHRAFASADRLQEQIRMLRGEHTIPFRTFQADALDGERLIHSLHHVAVDVIMTDLPYGRHSKWAGDLQGSGTPAHSLLEALWRTAKADCLVAVISDKSQKISHAGYQKVDKFQIGKRQVQILEVK